MSTHRLDVPALYAQLAAKCRAEGLSWRDLGDTVGVAPSCFSRMAKGHAPDAHALVSLLVWLDLDTDIVHLITPGGDA